METKGNAKKDTNTFVLISKKKEKERERTNNYNYFLLSMIRGE